MKLIEEFKFIDPNGMVWISPKDSITDGASIPKFAWPIIGSPFKGKYRAASVIHDISCKERVRTWESVHLAFYYAMMASGVSRAKAKVMYAAVYFRGPRWNLNGVDIEISPKIPENVKVEKMYELGFRDENYFKNKIKKARAEETEDPIVVYLFSEIESREKSGSPMSLGEIREYFE
ncbi:DUF1353 domain-containing protein [Desulfosediminicola sp.]|uniref:DUF1353 domain-containing protein n=1 Tax=Desulfosediminicola sp. TaxID=2886825 RepID=UPI003AF22234